MLQSGNTCAVFVTSMDIIASPGLLQRNNEAEDEHYFWFALFTAATNKFSFGQLFEASTKLVYPHFTCTLTFYPWNRVNNIGNIDFTLVTKITEISLW